MVPTFFGGGEHGQAERNRPVASKQMDKEGAGIECSCRGQMANLLDGCKKGKRAICRAGLGLTPLFGLPA